MKIRNTFQLLLVIAVVFFATSMAFADTLAMTSCADGSGATNTGALATASSCSGSVNTASAIGSSSATSSADYGVLKVLGNATSNGGTGVATAAQAQFTDTLTFSGFSGTAYLQLTEELSGSITQTITGTGITGSSYNLQSNLSVGGFGGNECNLSNQTGTCTVSLAILAGDTVDLQMLLALNLSAAGTTANITGDFSHTGKVDNLLIVDANGNVISGAQIMSASGTTYPTGSTANAVPEPASLILIGSGVLLGGVRRKRIANR